MRGTVSDFDGEDNELKAFLPKPQGPSERVSALTDSGVPGVDLSSLDLSDIPAAPAPKMAEIRKEAAAPVRSKQADFFSSTYSTPVELDQMLIEKYGIEWLEWEPETLWTTIQMDFATEISRSSREKINAAKLLHLSDSFWKSWDVFEKVVIAFNGLTPLFDRVQEISLGQMLHGVLQATVIRKEEFQGEVLSYIAARCKEDGLIWLPAPLDVVQETLDSLNPPEIVPLKDEIQERWEAIASSDFDAIELKEDLYGIHLAKLAAADRYLAQVTSPEVLEDI
jgi:hypothetical protein